MAGNLQHALNECVPLSGGMINAHLAARLRRSIEREHAERQIHVPWKKLELVRLRLEINIVVLGTAKKTVEVGEQIGRAHV